MSPMLTLTVSVTASPTTVYSAGTSTITILVTSDDTPITGATVSLTSDAGGSFSSVTDQGDGSYTATFTAPTVSTSTTVKITAEASKEDYVTGQGETWITVEPSPPPALTVSVSADPTTIYSGETPTITVLVTSEGTPISDATISLASDKGGSFSTVTEHADGTYTATFTAPTVTTSTICTITADASKSGYTSSQGQTQVTVQPLVADRGNLNIYVKDADGNPIAVATVTSTSQPSGQTALSGTTDANGLVVFNNILAGSYTIKASKTEYEDKAWTVTVIAGQTTTDTVTLSKLAEALGIPLMWIAIAILLIVVIVVGAVFAIKKTRTPRP